MRDEPQLPHVGRVPYVGALEAARRLGVTRQTLNNWVWRGRVAVVLTEDHQPLYPLDMLELTRAEFCGERQ